MKSAQRGLVLQLWLVIACHAASQAAFQAFLSGDASAQTAAPSSSASAAEEVSFLDRIRSRVGVNYFSFVNGPGLDANRRDFSPNSIGRFNGADGLNMFNLLSVRIKFSENLAFDWQNRFRIVFNNAALNPQFTPFIWESPRIGISGTLLKGETWSLAGALNTDFPGFFPAPLSGFTARERAVLFNLGLFAALSVQPKGSRFSISGIVAPRFFIYSNREAAEPQLLSGGFSAGNKPELVLAILPTLNYQVTENLKVTLGTTIDYRKQVLSSWNPFRASLASNGDDPAWRLDPVPLMLGVTYRVGPALTLFPYIQTFPIAASRINQNTGAMATLLESTSIGMWISGVLL